MADEKTCSIWGTEANVENISDRQENGVGWVKEYLISSPRTLGEYGITREGYQHLVSSKIDDHAKARLTTWIIAQRRGGVRAPLVDSNVVDYAIEAAPMSVGDRALKLLKCVASRVPCLGGEFRYYPKIESTPIDVVEAELLAHTESSDKKEITYLFNYLLKTDLIDDLGSDADLKKLTVSADGYAKLAELEKANVDSAQAFVAMWFDDSMEEIYRKGIEPAIQQAGYEPLRIDKKDHNNKIDDEIISEIRRSKFLVADFTHGDKGMRGGVYYEAGFAHGLNIPVIFACRSDLINEVHFDTRQYNHIVWSDPDDLREQLGKRISATFGDGPAKLS